MTSNISPLATQVLGRQDGIRTRAPWGAAVHTTGGSITEDARLLEVDADEHALDVYVHGYVDAKGHKRQGAQFGGLGFPWGGPSYLIGHRAIYQMASDTTRTSHVGSITEDKVDRREQYLSGQWRQLASPMAVACWEHQWPGHDNPQDLFPDKRPNDSYVGIEMIPCGDGYGERWTQRSAQLRFSEAQHQWLAELLLDIAERHGWPADWSKGSRVVGHEDVGLLDRSDDGGGWDPGWLRAFPYIDFAWVRAELGRRV